MKRIIFTFLLLVACFGFAPKAEAGYYTTWWEGIECLDPMNSSSGSTGDKAWEEDYNATLSIVDPMDRANGDDYGEWRTFFQAYADGCTRTLPPSWGGTGELTDMEYHISLTFQGEDEYGNLYYKYSDWVKWIATVEHEEYIPTPPAMDILVNGQSPTGQVAKTGTRLVYGYATGCWNWESNHWKLLKQTNNSFACSSYPDSYFLQNLYGEIGTETYTYYVTEKVPLELRTGDQLTVSWTLTRGQNTNDQLLVDAWNNVMGLQPNSVDYTGSRTVTLFRPQLLTFTFSATNEDGAAQDTEQVNVSGPTVTPTTPPPTTTTTTTPPPTTTTTTTTLPPTLDVALSANPSSGPSPLTSTLTASVSGTATGTINYTFWWNCVYTGTSVATAISQCGDPDGAAGNANGNKYDGISANPKSSMPHAYSPAGTYTAKVIVERGFLADEDRETVTVTSGDPTGCLSNCDGDGGENYGVFPGDYCSGVTATVAWQYSDPNGDPQSAYQVQLDEAGSSFGSPVLDTGKIFSSGNSYSTGAGVLQFNVTYKARVRVWDSNDSVSSWDESDSWKTPKHAYPQVDFIWTPLSPNANQSVQFTDQTTFYDSGGGQRNWSWLFGDGGSSDKQNPKHTYLTLNDYNVNLTAEDKDDYACSLSKSITVKKPVPIWKEIAPKE